MQSPLDVELTVGVITSNIDRHDNVFRIEAKQGSKILSRVELSAVDMALALTGRCVKAKFAPGRF